MNGMEMASLFAFFRCNFESIEQMPIRFFLGTTFILLLLLLFLKYGFCNLTEDTHTTETQTTVILTLTYHHLVLSHFFHYFY